MIQIDLDDAALHRYLFSLAIASLRRPRAAPALREDAARISEASAALFDFFRDANASDAFLPPGMLFDEATQRFEIPK